MSYINQVMTPDSNAYDIHATGIPYAEVDSTSTSTAYTATVPGITALEDGVCVLLRNNKVTSEANFTININGLGAKYSYSNMATGATPTRETTIFNINYTMLFVYSSTIISGGAWICYRGYDSNSNTIGYQIRTNSSTRPVSGVTYRYRILFSSADDMKWVPSNTGTSTNATTSRTVNQTPINPFGEIIYYSSTSTVAANANISATSIWQQYTCTFGYSFNRVNAALTLTYPAPVYIKCTPQTDGSAIMDSNTPYVQALPSSNDGYIYIYLGRAYSTTAIELVLQHPVFYHNGTGIRVWTGEKIPTKVSDLTNDSGFITSADVPTASTTSPKMDGTAAVGTESSFARGDHVHPTDTSRASTATFSTSINGLVPKPSSAATNTYLNSSGTWTTPPNTTYATATTAANGLMSSSDKKKLDACSTVDNNSTYSLTQNSSDGHKLIWTANGGTPSTFTIPDNNTTYDLSTIAGTLSVAKGGTGATNASGARTNLQAASTAVVTTASSGLMSADDKKKLDSIASSANNYTHPTFTAATAGPSANATLTHGGTVSIPYVTRNAEGHVDTLTNRTIQLPTDNNSTYKLQQVSSDGHKLAWSGTGITATTITIPDNNTTYGTFTTAANGLVPKPTAAQSTAKYLLAANGTWVADSDTQGSLSGTTGTSNYKVVLSKTASTATINAASTAQAGVMTTAQVSKLNGIETGANKFTHPTHTAGTVGPTANTTLAHGGTVSIPQVTVNSSGHVSALTARTITLPGDNNSTYGLSQDSSDGHKLVWKGSGVTQTTFTIPDNNTTYGTFSTAVNGLVPKPTAAQSTAKYHLAADGTWVADADTKGTLSGTTGTDNYKVVLSANASTATISGASTSSAGVMTTAQVSKLNGAFTGVSRSGTTWTFTKSDGSTTTVAQQDNNTTYTMSISTAANSTLHLVSGSSTIANVTVPNTTNTTYGTFSTAANGLVPNPTAAQSTAKCYLAANGTWIMPPSLDTVWLDGSTATNKYTVTLHNEDAGSQYQAEIPLATSAVAGVVKPDGTASHCLNGTGGWSAFNNFTHPTHTAGTVGPTANATLSHGGTVSIPQVTVNSSGHVSALTARTITLPSDNNTTYGTVSSAELVAGTDTTSKVITAANLMNFIKNSVVPIGSLMVTTSSSTNPGKIGTWTRIYDIRSFYRKDWVNSANGGMYRRELNFFGYYTSAEGIIFAMNIPYIQEACFINGYSFPTSTVESSFNDENTISMDCSGNPAMRIYTVSGQNIVTCAGNSGALNLPVRSVQSHNVIVQTGSVSSASASSHYGSGCTLKLGSAPPSSKTPIIVMIDDTSVTYPFRLPSEIKFVLWRRSS